MKIKDDDISKLKDKYNLASSRDKFIELKNEEEIEDLSFLHKLLCDAAFENYLFTLPSFSNETSCKADFSCYKAKISNNLYCLVFVSIPFNDRPTRGLSGKVIEVIDLIERTFLSLDYLKSFQDTERKRAYIVSFKSIE